MTTIALLGDVMLGRGVNEEIGRRSPEWFWGDTLPVLKAADAVLCNLECAITSHEARWSRTHKVFHFSADPAAVDVLKAGNIQCVSLANNHILDFEVPGLVETIELLDDAGIAHAGAGRNRQKASEHAMLTVDGLRLAMVAATDNEPPFMATADRPGTNYLDIHGDNDAPGRVAQWIASARDDDSELVVLSLHWGPNMVARPPKQFQTFARSAVEHGADLLHGHSAHILQAVSLHNNRPILYDTGDFLDDYAIDKDLHNDWSMLFLADIEDGAVRQLRLRPVHLTYAQVNLATGDLFERIRACFRERCAGFDTPLRETDEGFEIDVQPSPVASTEGIEGQVEE